MLFSYFRLALRNLLKHKLYSFINIAGLAIGIGTFLFSLMLADYEQNHDHMFSKRDRIFTVGSLFAPTSGEPISEYPDARLAYAPSFKQEIADAEQVVRTVFRRHTVSYLNHHQHLGMRYVDPGFGEVFDFTYLAGDATALRDEKLIVITASTAQALFNSLDVLGHELTIAHNYTVKVGAVIADTGKDNHFNASKLPDTELVALASINALTQIDNFDLAGEWDTLNPSDMTYILMPPDYPKAKLQRYIDEIYQRVTPQAERDYISGLKVRPLVEINTQVWEALGFPVIEFMQLLGLMVLLGASLNYANLATAQSFGRSREIGLRKTMGADPTQLILQLSIESLTLISFASLLALASLELIVPAFNQWSDKALMLNYKVMLTQLIYCTLLVSLVAGTYPVFIASRQNPVDSLNSKPLASKFGPYIRSFMIMLQFSISIFILAMVMIIMLQNQKVQELSADFPRQYVLVMHDLDLPGVKEHQQELRNALLAIDGVENVALSGGIPFLQAGGARQVALTPDAFSATNDVFIVAIDENYFETYGIELVAGDALSLNHDEGQPQSVIINGVFARTIGLADDESVIGKTFFQRKSEGHYAQLQYRVSGLMPDQYFMGVHTKMRPIAFTLRPEDLSFASVRVRNEKTEPVFAAIKQTWAEVLPAHPLRAHKLDFYFLRFFSILIMIGNVITVFAVIAMSLALFGLFGLAAFMTQNRTQEIGIRKVMGASVRQIVLLLIWQLSRPVLWSMAIAIPLAYFTSDIYLGFFPESISWVIPVILLAGIIAIITAWLVIGLHALRIARARPIESLRYVAN